MKCVMSICLVSGETHEYHEVFNGGGRWVPKLIFPCTVWQIHMN